jgi:hypothetical protein
MAVMLPPFALRNTYLNTMHMHPTFYEALGEAE